jgi:hypothetical protein
MLGMVGAVAIPMSGVGLGGAVLAYPWLKRWIEGSEMPAAMMRRLQDVNMTMPDMSGWWEKTIKRLRWL